MLWRWLMGGALAFLMVAAPTVYYRYAYAHAKRLRVVAEGKVYRSGCLTAEGFRDAVRRLGIRTILNLQEEAPDPALPQTYLDKSTVRESEMCRALGVRLEFLAVDTIAPNRFPTEKPAAIAQFQKLMDDPSTYPVLIHCRAGLHRTGCLCAVYRMEYDGWSPQEALRELKAHGFGEFASNVANHYINQYVLSYEPRTSEHNRRHDPSRPGIVGQLTSRPSSNKTGARGTLVP